MTLLDQWQRYWTGLAARERMLVRVAGAVVAVGLAWGVGIAPALRTVQSAPARVEQLDRQLETVEDLAAQARLLQGRPVVRRDDAVRILQVALQQRMGSQAQMSQSGDRVTVTLSGVSPAALAQWMGQVRSAARVSVVQARLNRGAAGWDGSLVLQLPPE